MTQLHPKASPGDPTGGLDVERTARRTVLDRFALAAASPHAEEPVTHRWTRSETGSWSRVTGRGFVPWTQAYVDGAWCPTRYVGPNELLVEAPEGVAPSCALTVANRTPAAIGRDRGGRRALLLDVRVLGSTPVGTGKMFALVVEFDAPGSTAQLLRLDVRFPDHERRSRYYRIDEAEAKGGRKILEGFSAARGGNIEIIATVYDDHGHSDVLERIVPVVPSNPLQLYIDATSPSPSGRCAAVRDATTGEYHCTGVWTISNGNPFGVTVGPRVRCRTSDAGVGQLDDFSFEIGTHTLGPNATLVLYVTTIYRGNTHGLLRDYNDVRMDFTVQTSAGELTGWHIWVAMARVGITANFVGDFSWAEMLKVEDICENHASRIYAAVDCVFAAETPILEIRRDHPDWARFRDIAVEAHKSGACTNSDEARALRSAWSAPSEYDDRIDVFFVESFSGGACASSVGGFSPTPGPTGKGADNSGLVIDVKDLDPVNSTNGAAILALVVAHEAGHYLGLSHSTSANNFMQAVGSIANTQIEYAQWIAMRSHGFVKPQNP